MKTIAFFNEKGGVGKTTYSILYASWLYYKHGIKVGAADFNRRLSEYREKELEEQIKNAPDTKIKCWPIVSEDKEAKRNYERKNLPGHAMWLKDEIYKGRLKDVDVLFIDLPGTFASGEANQMVDCKLLGLNVVPTTGNFQDMQGAFRTFTIISRSIPNRIIGFFSKIENFNSKQRYIDFKGLFEANGRKILPDMISSTDRINKIATPDAIVSTLRYPDWEDPAYKGSKDLGLENLFIDITKELMKTPDLPGTSTADLSFVNSLKKKDDEQSLNRQFVETKFPEYELPLPEDMKYAFRKKK